MRRVLAYVALELATFWKRPINIMMFVVLSAMSFGFLAGGVRVSSGSADTGGAKNAVNSAFNLAFSDMFLFALILPFFTAIACGMPVLGDFDRRIHRLVAATLEDAYLVLMRCPAEEVPPALVRSAAPALAGGAA